METPKNFFSKTEKQKAPKACEHPLKIYNKNRPSENNPKSLKRNMSKTLLNTQDRKSLIDTKKVLEEVLETEEYLHDKELVSSLKQSKQDMKSGRTISWGKMKRELRSKGKL